MTRLPCAGLIVMPRLRAASAFAHLRASAKPPPTRLDEQRSGSSWATRLLSSGRSSSLGDADADSSRSSRAGTRPAATMATACQGQSRRRSPSFRALRGTRRHGRECAGREASAPAAALYRELGFQESDEREELDWNPKLTARVMFGERR